MSALSQIAKDSSCLLAVDALQGGRWLSSLRPPVPRNFAAEPMTFTDSYTAQDGIGTDDFTLSVDFTLLRKNVHGTINIGCMNCIYYDSTKGHQSCVRILKSDGTKGALYPVGTMHITGDIASIKVIKTGQNVRMVVHARDGSTLRDRTVAIPDGATVTSMSGDTTYPGNIFAASIRNDTTGTDVWQAAYSDLYDMSKPWPSDVPSNFAEEEKLFYDYQAVLSEQLDPTHDYSFFMDTEIVSDKSDCPMFYIGGADGVFGLYCYSNNTIRFTTNLLRSATNPNDKYASMLVYRGDARPAGRHSFEGRIEGNSIKTFFDNQPAFTSAVAARTNTKTVGCNRCSSGYVYKIQIEDLTTGKIVWRYPTWEERTQLLTFTNITSSGGVFRAADDAKIAGIATPLDFRGNTTSKTFIARAFCPAHDPASEKLYIHPFFGQGSVSGSSTQYTFQFSLWEDRRAGYNIHLRSIVSAGTTFYAANVSNVEPYLDQWHTYAMVVDYRGDSCYIRTFVDGTMMAERTVSDTLIWNTPAVTIAQEPTVGIRREPNTSVYAGSLTRISAALIFDRALTQPEIAAISNTMG